MRKVSILSFLSILFLFSLVSNVLASYEPMSIPDEGPFHWQKLTNYQTFAWWTPYTGTGAVAYDLAQDEEYTYINSTGKTKLHYHQVAIFYVPPSYSYGFAFKLTNKYYDSNNTLIGTVLDGSWDNYLKYDYLYSPPKVLYGGSNTSSFYLSQTLTPKVTTTVGGYGYAEGGEIYLGSEDITNTIN